VKKTKGFAAALVAVVALILTACSPTGSTNSGSAASTLTIGGASGFPQLNPAIAGTAFELTLYSLMWDGLVKIDQSGKLQPDLASSWSSSADLKTWTFKLVSGEKFSNGKALTATDVVSSFDYYKKPTTTTQFKNNLAPITSVVATTPSEVTFTLSAANSLFPSTIEPIKILDIAAMKSIDKTPVVTGPYKVKSFTANNSLVLERNPEYTGKKQGANEIDFETASDSSAAVTSLQSGDLDADWSVPLSQAKSIKANPDLQLVSPRVIGQYVSWEVDTTSAPFNNVKARQALAFAIDRKAILDNAYYGQGSVSDTNNPIANNSSYFGGKLTNYSYNLATAKKLFAEAGVKSGSKLTWYGTSNAYPEWNTSAQILQASLKQIGINLVIKNVDLASWPALFYPAGKSFPATIIPNFQSYQPVPSDLFQFVRTGRCECNWNNSAFEADYASALATPAGEEQNAIWAKMQELVNQQVPIYVPVQFATITAASRKVSGLWVDGTGTPHLEAATVKQ
jgi:peptide/nickel transport system substrate-binding protein